eukprot:6218690-Prymnesium_polylepis.1
MQLCTRPPREVRSAVVHIAHLAVCGVRSTSGRCVSHLNIKQHRANAYSCSDSLSTRANVDENMATRRLTRITDERRM